MEPTISKVKEKYSSWLMGIKNVNGVAIEYHDDGTEYINVSVLKLTPEIKKKIPTELEGYQVEVEEVGEISAQ
jgi:hypothetical protein